jgi:hypothetical protein
VHLGDALRRRRPVVDHAGAGKQHAGPRCARPLENPERPDDVVLERGRRVVDRLLDGDRRGEVRNGVDAGGPPPDRSLVADVSLLEGEQPRVVHEFGEVGLIAGDQAVNRQHRVPASEQLPDDPAADEPGGPRDEDPHARAPSGSAA